jgi:glycosyltransferase involved in cell wall biosynthesis
MTKPLPMVSIVITTHNRSVELRRALESCVAQTYPNLEVIVFDDGSSDGTTAMIAAEFPGVRVIRDSQRRGYIVRRNQGFVEAQGKYAVSIDDDAFFSHPQTIEPAVELLETSERIAAVAMSYTENTQMGRDQTMDATDLRSYVGCAHAIRRDAALRAGGYRELLIHQGEERDLCIRLIDAGYRIAYCPTPPIIHRPSPIRDRGRMERFGLRNTLLFDVLNVPMPYVVFRLIVDCIKLLVRKPGWPISILRGWYLLCALAGCVRFAHLRRPVSRATYRQFIRLPRHGPEQSQSPAEPISAGNTWSSIYSSSASC